MHVLSLHKVDLVGVVLTGLTAGYVMALVLVSGAKRGWGDGLRTYT